MRVARANDGRSVVTLSIRSLNARRLAHWLLWISLAVHVPIAYVATVDSKRSGQDFDNYYYNIGTKAGRPYLDYPLEFPVATVQAFRLLGPLAGTRQRFGVILVILNLVADLAIVGALAWGWGVA